MSTTVAELSLQTRAGDESFPVELTSALYGQLRRIAYRHLGNERRNHTLQPTALVHEAYLKLNGAGERTLLTKCISLP